MIRRKSEKYLYPIAWAASILAFPLPAYAESELAKQVLKAVSNVSDAIVTILLGLIVLMMCNAHRLAVVLTGYLIEPSIS